MKNPDLATDKSEASADSRKAYVAPVIIHEAEMETRAGSPLFAGDPSTDRNPWDPDYGSQANQ